jgi:protein TonB
VIEKDGTVNAIEVLRKLSQECDAEAIRVIKAMPKWIPGRQNGVNVSVRYTIAVNFG